LTGKKMVTLFPGAALGSKGQLVIPKVIRERV